MAQDTVAPAVEVKNGVGAENGNGTTKAVNFFSLKPQLVVPAGKGADAVTFYKAAFGAEELKRDMHPKRKADQELPLILSAELKLGSSVLIVADNTGDSPSVKTDGSGYTLCLETDDVKNAVVKAVKAGAVAEEEAAEGEDACCGSLVVKVKDPYGYVWAICSGCKGAVEDVAA